MKKRFYMLASWFADCRIKTKMRFSYLIIIIITMVSVSALLYVMISASYKKQILHSADLSFLQAEEFLEYRLNSMLYASDILRSNPDVQSILNKSRRSIEHDIVQQNKDMRVLEKFLYSLLNSIEVYQISLYVPDYLMYADQDVIFRSISSLQEESEYSHLLKDTDNVVWLPPEELYSAEKIKRVKVISFLRKITNMNQLNEVLGVHRISIRYEDISSIVEKSNITSGGVVYVMNSRGDLITCSNDNLFSSIEGGIRESITYGEEELSWKEIYINGKKYIVNAHKIDKTDWMMTALIPKEEILKAGNDTIMMMLLVMVIITLLTSLLAGSVSNSITRRISTLAENMELVQNGDWEVPAYEGGNDEIGFLFQSFEYMSGELKNLAAKQYENGKAVKSAELKALQAQINPHFLYNTLDLINWEAMDNGAGKISDITQALAKFYKLSLNKGKDIVSIRDELYHVAYYVQIQNYRFDERIQFIEEVPEEIKKCSILHIVLQPLVENSILHGMMGKKMEDPLIIWITASVRGDTILIEAKDNGTGMNREQMDRILTGKIRSEGSGYGVRNIDKRLRLHYGEEYGLEYRSNEEGGVTVRICIPKIRYRDEQEE